VSALLPDAETFQDDDYRELSDAATGIQAWLEHDQLKLTVPYWYSGADAERLITLLRRVVLAIEEATGLTAYDDQARAPFIGSGDAAAAGTFDQWGAVLDDLRGSGSAG
jgi:hypothetical protein